jgi:hypothetical protein
MRVSEERPRLLVLDLLETYARERAIHVVLERVRERDEWVCILSSDREAIRSVGTTARQAIGQALRQEGVDIPD